MYKLDILIPEGIPIYSFSIPYPKRGAPTMAAKMAAQVAEKMVEQMQMAEPAPMPQAHQLFRRRELDRRPPRRPPRTSGSSSAA